MIPMMMKLRVDSRKFRVKLWIPLVLIWLLLLALFLLLLPFVAIAWAVAAMMGWRIPLLRLLPLVFELLGSLRETEVHIVRPASSAELEISML